MLCPLPSDFTVHLKEDNSKLRNLVSLYYIQYLLGTTNTFEKVCRYEVLGFELMTSQL